MSPQENLCLGSIIVRLLAVWQILILNIKIWHFISRKLQDEYKLEDISVSLKFKLSLNSHEFLKKTRQMTTIVVFYSAPEVDLCTGMKWIYTPNL